MTATCQPIPQSVAQEMLQVVARAVCDRPGETDAQRESRTRQMVHATLGCEPRDGLEYMLSTLVFAHFNLILDSMRDVFQGQMDSVKQRTKTNIVALDRSMLGLLKELRAERKRPLTRTADDAPPEAIAAQTPPGPTPPGPTPLGPIKHPDAIQKPKLSSPTARAEAGDTLLQAHIAAFEDALSATAETLREARALDGPCATAAGD
jgi:hypothetical protein